MTDSAKPIEELSLKLQSTLSDLISNESQSSQSTAETIVSIAQTYVSEHSNDPVDPSARRNSGPKRDTPGAETFSWTLWESLLEVIGGWQTEEQFVGNLDRAIEFVKALQARPEDELKWTIWGSDTSIRALPLVGPSMREANNGPFTYKGPDDDAMGRPEVQNALAGAPPSSFVKDEAVEIAFKRRKQWLALQAFVARLWADAGVDSFAVYSVWAARDGLEDWPVVPPAIFEQKDGGEGEDKPVGEDTPAFRALMVEGAALWLKYAAPKIYACTEIWGPNGNPEWPKNQGAPGRGGERWKGVDGMDKEKQRWALWREVLKDVVAWYDREEVGGRGAGWRLKETVTAALEAMYSASQK